MVTPEFQERMHRIYQNNDSDEHEEFDEMQNEFTNDDYTEQVYE